MDPANRDNSKLTERGQGELIRNSPAEGSGETLSPEIEVRLSRLLEVCAELEARKRFYAEYDSLVMDLLKLGFVSAVRGDQVIQLKDNFGSGNTGWTSAAVKRFEIEVISKELAAKRQAKKEKANG